MLLLQVPRLTTTLRTCSNSSNSIRDVDRAYLDRKSVLENKHTERPALSTLEASDVTQQFLMRWKDAPYHARKVYEEFLGAVAELVGIEVLSEELHEAASIVYNVLSTEVQGSSASDVIREKDERLASFGSFDDRSFEKAKVLVERLQLLGAQQLGSLSAGGSMLVEKDVSIEIEFGTDLEFKSSPHSASRIFDEEVVDLDWDYETGQPKTSVQKQQGSAQESIFSSSNGNADMGVTEAKVDLRWLKGLCDKIALSGVQFSGDELAMGILNVLDSEGTGDEIAGELFDIIGDLDFEQIQKILQHRKYLVESSHKGLERLKLERAGSGQQSRMPSYGTQVSVQTNFERQTEKLRRKEEKRSHRRAGGKTAFVESEIEWLTGVGGFPALVKASEGFLDNLVGKGDELGTISGTSLPQGTIRKVFKGYEEVKVPAVPTAGVKPGEHLVKVAELDDFVQTAFEGYKTLNRIQSRIFQAAYHSNENILVCAPTGAGKTNIAMIAILREVGQHLNYGILQKNEFKIIYVAPMKALAGEMTTAFSRRLGPLNVVVRELTGDMQLTKRELEETQVIITTPEKWDVITRKSSDMALAELVKLLIIDEVHLLNDDRGPVIEAIVARTLRQVESSQSMIRIIGLSATLPNFNEVARFLGVNLDTGLFFFDSSYRPVPLTQQYIGVTETNFLARNNLMNEICYEKVLDAVKHDKQAMVFVHSRKDTGKVARILVEIAQRNGEIGHFVQEGHPQFVLFKKEVAKSRNHQMGELFQSGYGIHHAGMLRSDRNLTERLFSIGMLKVLVCTATLAWGVNLPAHTVVIKGTQLYDPKAGGWRELGILDVMQIFGRAGRPQFDKSGEGIIITTHDKLAYYLRLLTHQLPIESQFVSSLKDNLNAEVVLGTVTNIKEASSWLGYTYLFVRMASNPLAYGMSWEEVLKDPSLTSKRKSLIIDAARALDKAKMMRFDEKSGNFYVTDLGRVSSHYYIQYTSVETYNNMIKRHMNESELINLVAHSSEFETIMVREEEHQELENLRLRVCPVDVRGGSEDKIGKIIILIQVYISRVTLDGFSLIADSAYISASLGRIMRALFEICLRKGWCSMTALLLEYCKAVDHQIWPHQHALRQFERELSPEILRKIEDRGLTLDRLYDMDEKEIGSLLRYPHGGKLVKQCLASFPRIHLSANISPITRSVLQVVLTLTPDFVWKDRWHGTSERWWIWVEDSENEHIYHSEQLSMIKKSVSEGSQTVTFTIPIFEPLPPQYYIRVVSDRWLQAESFHTVSFRHLILPELHPPHTELLDLRPLPVSALNNKIYEGMYKFSHFNPIQTQAFHILYHTDNNVLLGAPTGSGKTISAELAMLHLFNTHPEMKVIYIAPLKALVKERIQDWGKNLVKVLGKKMVELTGDFTPDLKALHSADLIISTPEKWDSISRNWHSRSYVTKMGLMIIDEIHLLGGDRGPILEVIVSRMRYISSQTEEPIRFVGLSTALANAQDLANWLGIDDSGLFNFKPSVRPVPLEVHIQGYPGKFYCPRMNSMNKPAYAAIETHSPVKPVLIFVSSRRQTRLTAFDLIQFAIADERPKQFLHMSDNEMEMLVSQVLDSNLNYTLQFGIGLHHAGLKENDRSLVEELFTNNKIQVLVSTSTLAWGVNLPAHLVIIKGTEYYDGRSKRYVDFPITDVLQMMGRAGRPQYDQLGKAVILVHEPKKSFYKKFLYEPFPVESSLHQQLHDHFNAEIIAGTIVSKQDALDYLTWTYLFRRLSMNPSYYDLETTSSEVINAYLSSLVTATLQILEDAGCVRVNEDGIIEPLMLGSIASQYYLSYKTVSLFCANVHASTTVEDLIFILSAACEYDELPVRHNEDNLNGLLAKEVRLNVDTLSLDDPHVKANLLLQAHFMQLDLPISDYVTDTKSILDQSIRIIQALVDLAASGGWLRTALNAMHLLQMVMQGLWFEDDNKFTMLPYADERVINVLKERGLFCLQDVVNCPLKLLLQVLQPFVSGSELSELTKCIAHFPQISIISELQNGKRGDKNVTAVTMHLRRTVRTTRWKDARAYTPRYPKVKDESWWIVLGSKNTGELFGLKRVSFVSHLTTQIVVPSVTNTEDMTLFLVSDCYVGLDQEYSLKIKQ